MEAILPQALTAEENVIGTVLIYPDSLNDLIPILNTEMFFLKENQDIYNCFLKLRKENKQPDLINVTEMFISNKKLSDVTYLNRLTDPIVNCHLIKERAIQIKEKYILRRCIETATLWIKTAYSGDMEAVDAKIKTDLLALSELTNHKGKFFNSRTMNNCMSEAELQEVPNMLFSEFWHEYELCILFSYTGYGKSTLAMSIAMSISEGMALPGFKLEAKKQKVLYFDFELSEKQLQGRYSKRDGKKYIDTYKFNDNFIRTTIDILSLPANVKFEDYLIQQMEELIISSGIKIVIIDNLTCVKGDVEAAKDAIPFMRRLNILKRTYNLSILVLAHTPKRNESHPLSLNDLSGSSALSKFCDSCFAIGKSPKDSSMRYLKQLKEKETDNIYGSDNIVVCQLEQVENLRVFSFMNYGSESDYLKSVPDEEKKIIESMVLERHREGLSYQGIANEFRITKSKVYRIINRKDEKSSL